MADTNLKLLFLDVETTGHDPLKSVEGGIISWHEVIEIGAVIADPQTLETMAEFNQKVRPKYPDRCLPDLVNHYQRRAAAGEWDRAVSLRSGMVSLCLWIRDHAGVVVPGGHNFFFDWSFLTVAFAECGFTEGDWNRFFHYTRFDTRSMAIQELWVPGTPYDPSDYSLRSDRLAGRLGIPPEPYPHEALNGARQSLEVFRKLAALKTARLIK